MSAEGTDTRLVIILPEKTLASLRSAMTVRLMAGSEGGGVIDAFVLRVLKCIEEGKTEHVFTLKRDPT